MENQQQRQVGNVVVEQSSKSPYEFDAVSVKDSAREDIIHIGMTDSGHLMIYWSERNPDRAKIVSSWAKAFNFLDKAFAKLDARREACEGQVAAYESLPVSAVR